MKKISIKIVESVENVLLLDIGIAVNKIVMDSISKEPYLKLYNGNLKLKTKDLLFSHILVEMEKEDIPKLEVFINCLINTRVNN